jgi:hypothetical protein
MALREAYSELRVSLDDRAEVGVQQENPVTAT